MQAYSPFGYKIVGTLDTIPGVARIEAIKRTPSGELDIEYTGHTDIFWDNQTTIKRNGEMIFVDEAENEVPASQIIFL